MQPSTVVSGLVVLVAIVALERGANYLVDGLGWLVRRYDLSEAVAGASVAAMGSSMPEFGSAVAAVANNEPEIGFGVIVGSAVFNVTVVIGGAALFGALAVQREVLYRDGLFYLLTVCIAIAGIYDGTLTRLESALWAVSFLGYFLLLVRDARRDEAVPHEPVAEPDGPRAAAYVLGGLATLAVASHYLVIHVERLAGGVGVSAGVVSLLLVAVGTSVPDLFTSLQAARQGMGSLAISNALGSNVFDILAAIGIPYAFRASTDITTNIDVAATFLLGSVVLVLVLQRYGWEISRRDGVVLLAFYAVYLGYLLG